MVEELDINEWWEGMVCMGGSRMWLSAVIRWKDTMLATCQAGMVLGVYACGLVTTQWL